MRTTVLYLRYYTGVWMDARVRSCYSRYSTMNIKSLNYGHAKQIQTDAVGTCTLQHAELIRLVTG